MNRKIYPVVTLGLVLANCAAYSAEGGQVKPEMIAKAYAVSGSCQLVGIGVALNANHEVVGARPYFCRWMPNPVALIRQKYQFVQQRQWRTAVRRLSERYNLFLILESKLTTTRQLIGLTS